MANMLQRFNLRRREWLKLRKWIVIGSVFLLISWSYRSWVIQGVRFVSSPSYRECVNRRSNLPLQVDKKPELFVTMAIHGRLGNWMYQYASLLGIARSNGYTPYFLSDHMLTYGFQVTHLRPSPAECLTTIADPKPLSYIDSLSHLPTANITLDGYFQSWKYFSAINDEIRQEFKFDTGMELAIRRKFDIYVGRHVRAGRDVISIHVRRGDIVSSGAKRLGYRLAPAAYFANAMRYMVKRHPYCVFLIVSDDIEWCRKNINTVALKYRKTDNDESKQGGGQIFVVNEEDGVEELVTSTKNVEKLLLPQKKKEQEQDFKGDNNSGDVYLRSPPLVVVPRDISIIDFGFLTLANHSIMSVGTFGWWGAWLAGGEVVYYENWLEEGHSVHAQWTKEDFFPHHWVAMSGGWSCVFESNSNSNMLIVGFLLVCYLMRGVIS